jgi:hypothetical protein
MNTIGEDFLDELTQLAVSEAIPSKFLGTYPAINHFK